MIRRLFLVFLILTGCLTAWNTNWSNRIRIDFNDTSLASEVMTDYTILVTIDGSSMDYSAVNPDGSDIRILDGDDLTPLPFHIEDWDTNGVNRFWIRVPQADFNSGEDGIYLYYGNSAAVSNIQSSADTYDDFYTGVWHLGETSGVLKDSTRLSNHGEIVNDRGGSYSYLGQGNGVYLDTAFIRMSNATSWQAQDMLTIQAFFILEDTTPLTVNPLVEKVQCLRFKITEAGYGIAETRDYLNSWSYFDDGLPSAAQYIVSAGVLHQAVVSYDANAGEFKYFIDGSLISSWPAGNNLGDSVVAPVSIGSLDNGIAGDRLNGTVLEVRIFTNVISDARLLADYYQVINNSSFYTMTSEELADQKLAATNENGFLLLTTSGYNFDSDLVLRVWHADLTANMLYELVSTNMVHVIPGEEKKYVAKVSDIEFDLSGVIPGAYYLRVSDIFSNSVLSTNTVFDVLSLADVSSASLTVSPASEYNYVSNAALTVSGPAINEEINYTLTNTNGDSFTAVDVSILSNDVIAALDLSSLPPGQYDLLISTPFSSNGSSLTISNAFEAILLSDVPASSITVTPSATLNKPGYTLVLAVTHPVLRTEYFSYALKQGGTSVSALPLSNSGDTVYLGVTLVDMPSGSYDLQIRLTPYFDVTVTDALELLDTEELPLLQPVHTDAAHRYLIDWNDLNWYFDFQLNFPAEQASLAFAFYSLDGVKVMEKEFAAYGGLNRFIWDMLDEDGYRIKPGTYILKVSLVDGSHSSLINRDAQHIYRSMIIFKK